VYYKIRVFCNASFFDNDHEHPPYSLIETFTQSSICQLQLAAGRIWKLKLL
jgi:hypothetical protein